MENLLKNEQYSYMAGLNRLRDFLVNTQYDLSLRDWIAKTIDEHGFIRIQPDTYKPQMLENILRYALSIDELERRESEKLGLSSPRFRLVEPDSLVAIDVLWSLNGIHRPFHALKIFKEVVRDGRLANIPEVPLSPRVTFPSPRYLYVGTDWESSGLYTGLNVPYLLNETTECGFTAKQLPDGRDVIDIGSDSPFTVNDDALWFLFEYEIEKLLATYHDDSFYGHVAAYFWYTTSGIVSVNKGQLSRIDKILRRTQFKEDKGLNGAPDVAEFLPLTVMDRPEVSPGVSKNTGPPQPCYPLFDILMRR